jgi:hypothetical protein
MKHDKMEYDFKHTLENWRQFLLYFIYLYYAFTFIIVHSEIIVQPL